MFEKRKADKQAREAAALHAELADMLHTAQGTSYPSSPIVLNINEHCLYVIKGSGLFESRRGPGHWTGRSSGISIPIGAGIRVRTGASRGHYVQGTESPTIIDTGTVTFTTGRVVFTGPRYTREWAFSKLIAIQHFTNQPWTAIQVSNRQKTSGFTYSGLNRDFVHARLELAVSLAQGERSEVIKELQTQLDQLDRRNLVSAAPVPTPEGPASESTSRLSYSRQPSDQTIASPASPPRPAATATAPPNALTQRPAAAWYADPAGVAPLRWWDGSQWTSYTSGSEST